MPHMLPIDQLTPCPPCNCSATLEVAGRRYTRTRFYLRAEECPDNYHEVLAACQQQPAGDGRSLLSQQEAERAAGNDAPAGLLPIGVTTYTQLFSDAELAAIEAAAGAGVGQRGGICAAQQCATRKHHVMRAWLRLCFRCLHLAAQKCSGVALTPLSAAPSDELEAESHTGRLPEACIHRTAARGGGLKRTKFFFGAR